MQQSTLLHLADLLLLAMLNCVKFVVRTVVARCGEALVLIWRISEICPFEFLTGHQKIFRCRGLTEYFKNLVAKHSYVDPTVRVGVAIFTSNIITQFGVLYTTKSTLFLQKNLKI